MPKMRKKASPRKSAARKASARKPAARKITTRRAAAETSVFARWRAIAENYTIAAGAGFAVTAGLIVFVLWAGGYVGTAGGQLTAMARDKAVASGLDIRKVTLRGAHNTAHAEILDAIGPAIGASIVHYDLAEARAKVESLGWVRSASVSRLLPNTVHISIREREAAAVWQIDHELKLIDADGVVIRDVSAYEYSQLPMIVGGGAPEAARDILASLRAHPDLQAMTTAVVRVGERRWNLRLRNDFDVMLPESGYGEAIEALALLHAAHGTLDQPLKYIDLRDPERVVIRKLDDAA